MGEKEANLFCAGVESVKRTKEQGKSVSFSESVEELLENNNEQKQLTINGLIKKNKK